jgi:hypothetical protein
MTTENEVERFSKDSAVTRVEKYQAEVSRLRKALQFVADLADEELPHAKVGTGAEVALRHISRRANETLLSESFA